MPKENTREQVRENYKRILEHGRIGSIDLKIWITDWFQALVQIQIYYIPEVEGFLVIKDFLQAISVKFLPAWVGQ
ncbi:hypothetical protein NA56DRAFT_709062 [Hyaloscypha hepaticicola]|uniref:Uncharacterized protein n=1 Tax=Hyaloscypha hepaticicola TaxID=2082293 RepID=A0A2J6PQE0_9HELO|nr:hypothetical protein NA56DRAFT_709062 [Hyaloscypha hepaticicola]